MTVQAVFRVDATPGFEDAVEEALARDGAVRSTARLKRRNNDLVVLVESEDEDTLLQWFANRLRTITGVRGFERLEAPGEDVWAELGGTP